MRGGGGTVPGGGKHSKVSVSSWPSFSLSSSPRHPISVLEKAAAAEERTSCQQIDKPSKVDSDMPASRGEVLFWRGHRLGNVDSSYVLVLLGGETVYAAYEMMF